MRKLKIFVLKLGIYGLFFGGVLLFFGLINGKKVLNFWIYDEIDYNEWTVDIGDKGKIDYISNFFGKIHFINLNGLMRSLMGQHEMNGVVKLNNGYLLTTHSYETDEALRDKANALKNLDLYLKQKKIPMLFGLCPYTSSKYDPQLPIGISDYGNDNADRFMKIIEDQGISNLDFREVIQKDGLDQYSMMFRTDHHWTTEAGFYAYTKLLLWIEENTGAEIDEKVTDFSNYTLTTYKNWHLGSRGQRTGIYYAGIDDFTLITPNFDTCISDGNKDGNFNELLINYAPLKNKEYTSRYTYDHVMDSSIGNYTNINAKNSMKLLIVTDSFGKAVNPYLILSFKEVRTIHNGSSQDLTKEYIEKYDPDAVILLYYIDCIEGNNRAFSFDISFD